MQRDEAAVGCGRLPVEADGFGHDRPLGGVGGIAGGPTLGRLDVGFRRGPVAPAGEVVTVEETDKIILDGELVIRGVEEAAGGQGRPQGRGPLGIARGVGMEQVGKFLRLGVALRAGEEGPGVEQGDLGLIAHDSPEQAVDALDLFRRPVLGR